ncbi:MAG: GTPase [Solirubrobacterales bacterium]
MDKHLDDELQELCNVADLETAEIHSRTRVAVFGVWNSGKSTLIKRLLVELGRPIPDWLTIAGAPETNFFSTVSIGEETDLVDTPGVSDGMSLHEGEAALALRNADTVVVLLLPSLMTAEKAEILSVLKAEHVHGDGWPWPPHGIKVLVGQLDEFGLDPVEDDRAFLEFADSKLGELSRLLDEAAVSLPESPGFVVADLGAEVGDDRETVKVSDYERGDWDGIASLLAWLRNLPHAAIREAGLQRRLVSEAAAKARTAHDVAAALELQRAEYQVEIDECQAFHDQLELQLADARTELETDLEAFAASIYGGDLDADEDALLSRQREVIDDWFAKQEDWLADARASFEATVTLGVNEGGGSGPSALERLATNGQLSESAVLVLEEVFGADRGALRTELAKLSTDGDYWQQAERLFKSKSSAKIAKTVLVAAAVLPVVMQLADSIRTLQEDATPERERLVSELRNSVREANAAAVEEAEGALRETMEAIRGSLAEDIVRRENLRDLVTTGRDAQKECAALIEERISAVRSAVQNS